MKRRYRILAGKSEGHVYQLVVMGLRGSVKEVVFERIVDSGNVGRALAFARAVGRKIVESIGKKRARNCDVESGKLYDEGLGEVVLVGRLPSIIVEAFEEAWGEDIHSQKEANERRLEKNGTKNL